MVLIVVFQVRNDKGLNRDIGQYSIQLFRRQNRQDLGTERMKAGISLREGSVENDSQVLGLGDLVENVTTKLSWQTQKAKGC